ncbi:MAG: site-specific integrase [Methanobacteriaceae archaeon]|nr:site-specific integrase [Methanobacteriaceae archaeon]
MKSLETYKIEEDPLFIDFTSQKGLAEGTEKSYIIRLNKYVEFTGKTLSKLIEEAEDEEDLRLRMRKRKIYFYFKDFKEHIDETDYSLNYKNDLIRTIRTFYNHFDLMLPKNMSRKTRSDKIHETIDDLPSMEEIQKFLVHCNSTYKAITTLGLSSGMGRAEITSLTFKNLYYAIGLKKDPKNMEELIEILEKEDGTKIPTWNIIRVKTGKPYFTFSSSENLELIKEYLEELFFKFPDYEPELDDKLFRSIYDNRPHKTNAINKQFEYTNKKMGLRKANNHTLIRNHTLRKFFATTLERNKVPHLTTRWLLGHTIDPVTSAYFKADPEALKEDYINLTDQLTTKEYKVIVIDKYESITQRLDELENNLVLDSGKISPEEKFLLENADKKTLAELYGFKPSELKEKKKKSN